ncbi:hypothetical protein N8897_01940 [Candidatus Pelagibacter sp.]|nr:hypothetical protein [Candidatus Pelagibacter sp.]
MSEGKDNENEFERDFSEEPGDETTLNDETALNDTTSDFTEERVLETNHELLEDTDKTSNQEIDPIAEANESLITLNSAPFDQTLEIMSQTLANIDTKMDVENLQLQKLDQLSEIKYRLNRLEKSSLATGNEKIISVPGVTSKIENETDEDLPQSNIGHNQQEISELLEKIQTLENKIQAIENQSNSSNERFEKIESVVERFKDLENDIQVEYEEEKKPSLFKNLFKNKEKTEPYKKEIIIDEPEIQTNNGIPKDTINIIEEAEDNLKNTNSEILINEDYNEELSKKDQKPKSKNLNYGLGMLLLLTTVIVILFFFNRFQIIDLNFDKVTSNVFSLIDLILK